MKKIFFLTILTVLFVMTSLTVYATDSIEVERIRSGYGQHGEINAYDNGKLIWKFTTPEVPLTELQAISDVYQNNGTAYIAISNTLYALDANTGHTKWTVYDVGASNSFVFDKIGNIYISGYYGPNVTVISPTGNVLYQDKSSDYLWVYKLEIIGNKLYIYYELGEGGTKTLDISRFVNQSISVVLNGSKISFDQPPIMIQDRVMVPFRAIFEAMGYHVEWAQEKQEASAYNKDNFCGIRLSPDYNIITRRNSVFNASEYKEYKCDVAPIIVSDRLLVPVRAVSELAYCDVEWDGDSRTVYITYKGMF